MYDLKSLNKQAITAAKQHMGIMAWLTIALTVFVLVTFLILLTLFAQGMLPVWIATILLAALTYMSYTPLHEAAHRNINGQYKQFAWVNELCGYLVAPIIAIPYASHRVEHFTHHRFTNQADKDPDFVIQGLGQGIIQAIITVFKFIWVQNAFFAQHYWSSASRKERLIYCTELVISIGWRILFIAWVDQPGTVLFILVGYVLGGYFTAYWFAYRPHLPYEEAQRYKNTNSLIVPQWLKPLEWIWLGQNLHSIHHLFPRVPFYRYHALHKEIEPVLRAHGTPILGIFDRQQIPENTQ